MNVCLHTKNALFFSSIDAISEEIWTSLNCETNLYLHRDFLKSIEINHPEIHFAYIVLLDEFKNPIAFSTIQIINFNLESIKNDFELFIKKLRDFATKTHVFPNKKPLKLLISGNVFVSGEHGIFIKSTGNKPKIIKELAKAILHFVNTDKNLKIDAFLLKDFVKESLFISDELKHFKYHPFLVEPNMVLKLNKNWLTYEDYLAAMKTKFRVKAKKALQLSSVLKAVNITSDNLREQLPKMKDLYEKVADKAEFNLTSFNVDTYIDFKNKLKDNYILKSYWMDDKMVGFMSGMINQKNLDAHFVGIDYQLNRKYAIYQRMLYDYIHIAIHQKLETINFGRTASEIKSSVGAVPQDLTMYLRHKKGLTNKILKLFLQRIQPTPFKQKFPFKNLDTNENL